MSLLFLLFHGGQRRWFGCSWKSRLPGDSRRPPQLADQWDRRGDDFANMPLRAGIRSWNWAWSENRDWLFKTGNEISQELVSLQVIRYLWRRANRYVVFADTALTDIQYQSDISYCFYCFVILQWCHLYCINLWIVDCSIEITSYSFQLIWVLHGLC